MRKYLILFAAILCMFLMLMSCGTNENPGSVTQPDDPSISGPAETGARTESRQQEKRIAKDDAQIQTDPPTIPTNEKEQTAMKMNVQIGAYTFTATLENNDAVRELTDMMRQGSVIIVMDDFAGFEKVGPLGRSLTTSNSQTATTAGDIVLYNGDSIVMFYGSNSWSYTRIGKIDDLTNWEKALGSGSVTAIFTLAV